MGGAVGGTLTTGLSQALQGQQVQAARLAVASRDLNNTDIKGARRKVVNISTQTVNGQNVGVSVKSITRVVNMAYVQTAQRLSSDLEGAKISEDILARATQIFGSPKSQSAIGNLITDFEAAIEDLSRSASDGALQFKVVKSAAVGLTENLNASEKTIQSFREEIEAVISQNVIEFNNSLEEMSEINIQLNNLSANGADFTDLLDKRDVLLGRLKEFSGANYFLQERETAVVITGDGSFDFVNKGSINKLNFIPSGKGALSSAMTYANGGVSGITIKDSGGNDRDITASFKTGKIAALLKLRDETLPNMSEQLNQLAVQFKDTVNKAHNPGTPIPPLTEMKSEKAITATDFTLQTANDPGSILLVKDSTTNTYGTIEFAVLSRIGEGVGNACRIDLDQLKADIDTQFGGNYQLTTQDILNAVNGYYTVPQANVPPAGAQPTGWPGAWPLAGALANNAAYAGLATTSAVNGPYINNEYMKFDNDQLMFGAAGAGNGIAINETNVKFSLDGFKDQDAGFSFPMQINNLFVTDGTASNTTLGIKVRDDIASDPSKLARGFLKSRLTDPSDPTTEKWFVGNADAGVLLNISKALSKTFTFNAPGINLPKATLEQFANEILSSISILAEEAKTNKLFFEELSTQIEIIISQDSDPNMDRVLIEMIPVKEHYGALMHVIRVIQQMMEELLGAFR